MFIVITIMMIIVMVVVVMLVVMVFVVILIVMVFVVMLMLLIIGANGCTSCCADTGTDNGTFATADF
jgi:hypothetical protein